MRDKEVRVLSVDNIFYNRALYVQDFFGSMGRRAISPSRRIVSIGTQTYKLINNIFSRGFSD